MLRGKPTRCATDADYARFARFYIAHCSDFFQEYSLHQAVLHLIGTMPDAQVMLFDNPEGEIIACIQYRYDASRSTVHVDTAVLASEYRRSRVFYEGLRDLAKTVMREYGDVRTMQFRAIADNAYINRLYGKFARQIDRSESYIGYENIYSADMDQLLRYLKVEPEQAKA